MEDKCKKTWVIRVGGYGSFIFDGTEEEAEEMRCHKSNWEQAVARKRLADECERLTGQINQCANHPNYESKLRHFCDCPQCNSEGR